MQIGHNFMKEHGFTGSHHKNKEFRPSIPGYKRGGKVEHDHEKHDHHPKHESHHHADKHGYQVHKHHKG